MSENLSMNVSVDVSIDGAKKQLEALSKKYSEEISDMKKKGVINFSTRDEDFKKFRESLKSIKDEFKSIGDGKLSDNVKKYTNDIKELVSEFNKLKGTNLKFGKTDFSKELTSNLKEFHKLKSEEIKNKIEVANQTVKIKEETSKKVKKINDQQLSDELNSSSKQVSKVEEGILLVKQRMKELRKEAFQVYSKNVDNKGRGDTLRNIEQVVSSANDFLLDYRAQNGIKNSSLMRQLARELNKDIREDIWNSYNKNNNSQKATLKEAEDIFKVHYDKLLKITSDFNNKMISMKDYSLGKKLIKSDLDNDLRNNSIKTTTPQFKKVSEDFNSTYNEAIKKHKQYIDSINALDKQRSKEQSKQAIKEHKDYIDSMNSLDKQRNKEQSKQAVKEFKKNEEYSKVESEYKIHKENMDKIREQHHKGLIDDIEYRKQYNKIINELNSKFSNINQSNLSKNKDKFMNEFKSQYNIEDIKKYTLELQNLFKDKFSAVFDSNNNKRFKSSVDMQEFINDLKYQQKEVIKIAKELNIEASKEFSIIKEQMKNSINNLSGVRLTRYDDLKEKLKAIGGTTKEIIRETNNYNKIDVKDIWSRHSEKAKEYKHSVDGITESLRRQGNLANQVTDKFLSRGVNSIISGLATRMIGIGAASKAMSMVGETTQMHASAEAEEFGLRATARTMGIDEKKMEQSLNSIVSQGIISRSQAVQAMKLDLERRSKAGISANEALKQSEESLNRQMLLASVQRQRHYADAGSAMIAYYEGIKDGSSKLSDATGITKNISQIHKEFVDRLNALNPGLKLTVKTMTEKQKIEAEINEEISQSIRLETERGRIQQLTAVQISKINSNIDESYKRIGSSLSGVYLTAKGFYASFLETAANTLDFLDKLSAYSKAEYAVGTLGDIKSGKNEKTVREHKDFLDKASPEEIRQYLKDGKLPKNASMVDYKKYEQESNETLTNQSKKKENELKSYEETLKQLKDQVTIEKNKTKEKIQLIKNRKLSKQEEINEINAINNISKQNIDKIYNSGEESIISSSKSHNENIDKDIASMTKRFSLAKENIGKMGLTGKLLQDRLKILEKQQENNIKAMNSNKIKEDSPEMESIRTSFDKERSSNYQRFVQSSSSSNENSIDKKIADLKQRKEELDNEINNKKISNENISIKDDINQIENAYNILFSTLDHDNKMGVLTDIETQNQRIILSQSKAIEQENAYNQLLDNINNKKQSLNKETEGYYQQEIELSKDKKKNELNLLELGIKKQIIESKLLDLEKERTELEGKKTQNKEKNNIDTGKLERDLELLKKTKQLNEDIANIEQRTNIGKIRLQYADSNIEDYDKNGRITIDTKLKAKELLAIEEHKVDLKSIDDKMALYSREQDEYKRLLREREVLVEQHNLRMLNMSREQTFESTRNSREMVRSTFEEMRSFGSSFASEYLRISDENNRRSRDDEEKKLSRWIKIREAIKNALDASIIKLTGKLFDNMVDGFLNSSKNKTTSMGAQLGMLLSDSSSFNQPLDENGEQKSLFKTTIPNIGGFFSRFYDVLTGKQVYNDKGERIDEKTESYLDKGNKPNNDMAKKLVEGGLKSVTTASMNATAATATINAGTVVVNGLGGAAGGSGGAGVLGMIGAAVSGGKSTGEVAATAPSAVSQSYVPSGNLSEPSFSPNMATNNMYSSVNNFSNNINISGKVDNRTSSQIVSEQMRNQVIFGRNL